MACQGNKVIFALLQLLALGGILANRDQVVRSIAGGVYQRDAGLNPDYLSALAAKLLFQDERRDRAGNKLLYFLFHHVFIVGVRQGSEVHVEQFLP